MFEKSGTAQAEQGEGVEKLEQFIETLANRYQNENVPVNNDGRIDMKSYTDFYPDVQKDLERNAEWEKEWKETSGNVERRDTDGEKLEMLAYAIFAKNLGEEFIVARSSPHDDRVNKVDTLVLDRKTGNLICAFDEVGDTTGSEYEKKQRVVQEHNLKGGAALKYGLGMIEEDGEKSVALSSAKNVPIFYIALPKDRIEKGIKQFSPEADKQSEFVEKLFEYFVATLTAQIKGLELYAGRLNPALKEKVTAFKKVLNEIDLKRDK